jgi:hypothetical protein
MNGMPSISQSVEPSKNDSVDKQTKATNAEPLVDAGSASARNLYAEYSAKALSEGKTQNAKDWSEYFRENAGSNGQTLLARNDGGQGNQSGLDVSGYPATYNPTTGKLDPTYKPHSNNITIDGVTINRYPKQENLTTLATGAEYDALNVPKTGTRVYVVDDFSTSTVGAGSAGDRVTISHGTMCASILRQGLPGVPVTEINVADAKGNMTDGSIAAGIDRVIANEAKLQNKNPPDLSRVVISMSLGNNYGPFSTETQRTAIAKFTAAGGTFACSAGNEGWNNTGQSQNIAMVAASSDLLGSRQSADPQPTPTLAASSSTLGTNMIPNRPIASDSATYVNSGKLQLRVNPQTGGVESLAPDGNTWNAFAPASAVTGLGPLDTRNPGDLDGQKAGVRITPEKANEFYEWRMKTTDAAIAAHGPVSVTPTAENPATTRPARFEDLTANEKTALDNAVAAEYTNRFGKNTVMSVADYKTYLRPDRTSQAGEQIDTVVPPGMTAQNTLLSGEQLFTRYQRPEYGQASLYRQDAQGRLAEVRSYQSVETSTSAATPNLVVRLVQDRARQLNAAKTNANP